MATAENIDRELSWSRTSIGAGKLFVLGIFSILSARYLLRTLTNYSNASRLMKEGQWMEMNLYQVKGEPRGNVYPRADVTYIFYLGSSQHTVTRTLTDFNPDKIGDLSGQVCYLPTDPSIYAIDPQRMKKKAMKPLLIAIALWIGCLFLIAVEILGPSMVGQRRSDDKTPSCATPQIDA